VEVTVKNCIELNNGLKVFIQRAVAAAAIDVYYLNEDKYRDYAQFEECPTGLDVQLTDNHGFCENYYLTWEQLENAGF
jgi:hypothetical protein